jgi:flagellar biosynthetic protein FlhB
MAEDLGEKSEDATPKKRMDARNRGQVAKSTDLTAVVLLTTAMVVLAVALVKLMEHGGSMLRASLEGDHLSSATDARDVGRLLAAVSHETIWVMAPVLGTIMLAGAIGHLVQIGPLFAPKAIEPSFSKISPIAGFKRLLGLQSLVKAGLDIVKVFAVLLVAVTAIWQYEEKIAVLSEFPLLAGLVETSWMIADVTLRLLAVLLIIGIADMIWQKIKHSKDLRMSKQEVRDEMKNLDGDPEMKRRRMKMAQQIAMQRVGSSVPTADVIVTNPEHYSIAIRYDQDTMIAPVVVAKGVDALAMRIRQIARQHDIPIVERPPLARGLYRDVEVGGAIPPDFYTAVAEVLAYVFQLEGQTVAA